MTTASCEVNYVPDVIFITSHTLGEVSLIRKGSRAVMQYSPGNIESLVYHQMTAAHYKLDNFTLVYIIRLTHMKPTEDNKRNRAVDAKAGVLRRQGALHPHPESVRDEAFHQGEFFDPRDLVQVRYEMLRRHQVDGEAVTEVTIAFGVSRQAYYITEAAFEEKGISGLLPRRRGPRRAHKCTDEILDFVEQGRAQGFPDKEVSEAVRKHFGVSIHPRSLIRALARRQKKKP